MNRDEQQRSISDAFTYVITYMNVFPIEDRMDLSTALDRLETKMLALLMCMKKKVHLQQLNLAIASLHNAKQSMNDLAVCEAHLDTAFDAFSRITKRKSKQSVFIVDPEGRVSIPD